MIVSASRGQSERRPVGSHGSGVRVRLYPFAPFAMRSSLRFSHAPICETTGFRSRRFIRKARDRTAVAVRLSSIPISLASIPFNDNSRRRSSSAAVQSFTDDLLSPIGSVIGLAPSSPSVRVLEEAGVGFRILLRRRYLFLSRPAAPSKDRVIRARPKLRASDAGLRRKLHGTAGRFACEGGALKRRGRSVRQPAADRHTCRAAEAVTGWVPFFNHPHLVWRSLRVSRVSAVCVRAAAASTQRRLFAGWAR
jgi:hypothetical protein